MPYIVQKIIIKISILLIKSKNMKKIYLILIQIIAISTLNAQPWTVNSADFEFSMNITGKVKINENFINQSNSYMGAFVSGTCRGVVQATEVNAGDFYYFLTIYSNSSNGEEVTFKFQDENEVETTFTVSVSFVSDGIYGNPDNPFVWNYPDNTASTDFLFFSSDAQTGETDINSELKTVNLQVSSSANINNLVTYFAVPAGTEVFVGTEPQQSGTSQNNFSNPVIYTLKNGTDEQDWTVTISQNTNIDNIADNNILIYPNPTTGKVIINFAKNLNFGKVINVGITDITGKVICKKQFSINNNQLQLNLSEYGKGIYLLRTQSEDGVITKKIILK